MKVSKDIPRTQDPQYIEVSSSKSQQFRKLCARRRPGKMKAPEAKRSLKATLTTSTWILTGKLHCTNH